MSRPRGSRLAKKQSAFFSIATQYVSHCATSTEMSGEPSAAPVFTKTTTPVQEPLLAWTGRFDTGRHARKKICGAR